MQCVTTHPIPVTSDHALYFATSVTPLLFELSQHCSLTAQVTRHSSRSAPLISRCAHCKYMMLYSAAVVVQLLAEAWHHF
jgi:hypothetical protein